MYLREVYSRRRLQEAHVKLLNLFESQNSIPGPLNMQRRVQTVSKQHA